jgi:hypothetical protein
MLVSKCSKPSRRACAALAAGLVCALSVTLAWADDFVRLDHMDVETLESEFFRLRRPLRVKVHCEGAGDAHDEEMYAYGWILDLRSREVVWSLSHDDAKSGPGNNIVFDGAIDLPAGDYAAYFAPFTRRYKVIRLLGREIGRIWIDSKRLKKSRYVRRWHLRLSVGDASALDAVEELTPPVEVDDPRRFVEMIRKGDDAFESRGFTLPERMQVTVYAQGEFFDSSTGVVDIGWITNADTRRRVWELSPDNFKHGGGDFKNKVARETITLPAGNYVASYATDGSHSWEEWNAAPPYDPDGWGILIWAPSERDAARIRPFFEERDPNREIVSLVRQRDGVYVSQGFTLKRAANARVYALGEYDAGDHVFVDYGWIAEFGTDRIIWKMTHRNTRQAGGATKNRAADEVVELPAGDYVAYYTTDDSHAYRMWNAEPPHDPTHWGIDIVATDPDFGREHVELFDADERVERDRTYIVRMVRVGNDEHLRKRFTVERPTRVRIIAVGEGTGGQMYDFGWIEEVDTGTWVWEMTLRKTRHAGGAQKNRVFDRAILLDAGEYEAHFVTDSSHAWNAWNDVHPRNPNAWGITITDTENN